MSTRLYFCVTLVLGAAAAFGNGPAYRPSHMRSTGQPAWEPFGLQGVRIVQENLVIDLRSADRGAERPPLSPGRVEATYQLENPGPGRKLELLLPGTDKGGRVQATLDGLPVPGRLVGPVLPRGVGLPLETPGIESARGIKLDHQLKDLSEWAAFGLTVTLPPGPHVLTISYDAMLWANSGHTPTLCWQFVHVFAPAQEWAEFGGLDVTVHLPPGWAVASSPGLTREGDTLRGKFDRAPGDALAITFRASAPWYRTVVYAAITAVVFAGIGGLGACWVIGRWRGRVGGAIWPWALTAGGLWGVAVFVTGYMALVGPSQVVSLSQGSTEALSNGDILTQMLLPVVAGIAVPVGFLVVRTAADRRR